MCNWVTILHSRNKICFGEIIKNNEKKKKKKHMPQQWPKPQQLQGWIPNPPCQKKTPHKIFYFIIIIIFIFLSFLGPHPWHMDGPRLVVQLEL